MSEPFGEPDHDTDADQMVETPESLRDQDPEVPPMDRGAEATDRPLAAEKFGTTHAEEQAGEPLDDKVAQERPDVGAHDPVDDIVEADPGTFAADRADAEQTDEEVLGDSYGGSAAETGQYGEPVGRVVEPDEGAHTDTEKDVVATDVGQDAGGMSAEEAAMHRTQEPP